MLEKYKPPSISSFDELMSYFDPDFLEFFSELDQDNNKKWFDRNRKRYLKTIKEPFYEFIQELIIRLQQEDSELFTEPKESIFRVNRDLRFTKDKTPYKLHVSASMSTGGRKAMDAPGYYIQLSYNRMMFGGGLYNPSREGLYNIRSYIALHPDELSRLVQEESFTKVFIKLLGKKNKRLLPEFKETLALEPATLIDHKQFYYMRESPDTELILQKDFPDKIIAYYKAGISINNFLRAALKS